VQTKLRLEHVISFSDAIFAFSITFMAISIQIPNLPENLTQAQVIDLQVDYSSYHVIFILYAAVLTAAGL
jgi:uncharacterized membrane protein